MIQPGSAAEAADKAQAAWGRFIDGIERSQIKSALSAAGYVDMEPTEENLRECFADYVDCGVWRDLELEDIESLSIADMCRGLIRYCR